MVVHTWNWLKLLPAGDSVLAIPGKTDVYEDPKEWFHVMNGVMDRLRHINIDAGGFHKLCADKGNCSLTVVSICTAWVRIHILTVSSSPFRASCVLKSESSYSSFHCDIRRPHRNYKCPWLTSSGQCNSFAVHAVVASLPIPKPLRRAFKKSTR